MKNNWTKQAGRLNRKTYQEANKEVHEITGYPVLYGYMGENHLTVVMDLPELDCFDEHTEQHVLFANLSLDHHAICKELHKGYRVSIRYVQPINRFYIVTEF